LKGHDFVRHTFRVAARFTGAARIFTASMSRKSRKNVGLIGLGIIGTRAAASLRAAGFQVFVWSRSARPTPNFLGSPAEIAQVADVIQLFVSDAAALGEVLEAMGDVLTPEHVIICSATVGPEAVLEAAQFVHDRGARLIDAPFTGSKGAAEKGQLVYYVGGEDAAFLRAKPVLEATSKAIVRIGDIGHASTMKVVTNMISGVTAQVLAEALAIVQKAGLDPAMLAAAIEQNACRSGVIDLKLPKMVAGDYEPHFSLKHMFKDVQLGITMANALDLEIPVTTVTAGVLFGAMNEGRGDLDFAALYRAYAPHQTAPRPAIEPVRAQPQALPSKPARVIAPVVIQPAPAEAARVAQPPPPAPAPEEKKEKVAKVVEVPSIAARPRPARPVSRAPRVPQSPRATGEVARAAAPASSAAPAASAAPEAGPPINFVRRWFVSRLGG
jgi:3-hydroxyisobutyrate dehydrogenase-like beta-hydroxyacid dehydrogenase